MVVASLPQNLNSTKKQKIKIAFRIVTKVQKSFRANLNLFKCFIDFFDKSVDRKIQFMLNWHWIYSVYYTAVILKSISCIGNRRLYIQPLTVVGYV